MLKAYIDMIMCCQSSLSFINNIMDISVRSSSSSSSSSSKSIIMSIIMNNIIINIIMYYQ